MAHRHDSLPFKPHNVRWIRETHGRRQESTPESCPLTFHEHCGAHVPLLPMKRETRD